MVFLLDVVETCKITDLRSKEIGSLDLELIPCDREGVRLEIGFEDEASVFKPEEELMNKMLYYKFNKIKLSNLEPCFQVV